MKASVLSSFIAFELTPAEEEAGFDFNDNQIAVIQNLISACAEDLVKMTMEVDHLSVDAQKKLAHTKGQIDAFKYLLAGADVIRQAKEDEKED